MFEQTVLMSTLEKGDPCAACVHAVRTAAAWILQQSLSLAPLPLRLAVSDWKSLGPCYRGKARKTFAGLLRGQDYLLRARR